MKKKILFVETCSDIGGGQVGLLDMLRHLDRTLFTPMVLIPKLDGPLYQKLTEIPDLSIRSLRLEYIPEFISNRPALPILTPYSISRLKRVLGEMNPDIVHANQVFAGKYACIAAKRLNVPVIVTMRTVILAKRFGLHRFVDKQLVSNADRIVYNTLVGAQMLKQRTGSLHVSTIHNGLPLSKFFKSVDAKAVRHEFGFPIDKRLLIFVAQITEQKGHRLLIDALPPLLKKHPDVHVACIGSPIGKESLDSTLRKRAEDRGVSNAITWIGFTDRIPELMRIASFSVRPSLISEGLPRAIIESMAAGVPPIASNIGGVPELIEDGVNGFLCRQNDIEDLLRCLDYAFDLNRNDYHQMSKRNVELAQTRFSIEAMMNRYKRLYLDLLGGVGSRPR